MEPAHLPRFYLANYVRTCLVGVIGVDFDPRSRACMVAQLYSLEKFKLRVLGFKFSVSDSYIEYSHMHHAVYWEVYQESG